MNEFKLRKDICEIGRRIYDRGYAAGFDGNISVRLSENEVLCTPTMISKGFMQPDDLCVVDLEGQQLRGRRKRTSEVLLHLTIMQARSDVQAVVHCHPPHAIAFSLAREPIPQCLLPEVELCLGEVPTVPYQTPGSPAVSDAVRPLVDQAKIILLASHGTVSYDDSLEKAYWWTEVLDSYCRILLLARQLGPPAYLSQENARELLEVKQNWGFSDPRLEPGMENCDLCGNDVFRDSWHQAGLSPRAFLGPGSQGLPEGTSPERTPSSEPVSEDLVSLITEQVMQALSPANPQETTDQYKAGPR